MSNHQEIPIQIRKQIGQFQKKINTISSLKGAQRQQLIGKQEKHAKRIHRLMQTYQISIQSGAFQGKVQSHKSQYKQLQNQLNRLKKQLDNQRSNGNAEEELFKHKGKGANLDINNRDVVVEMGNRAQKQSGDALKRIIGNVNQMDEQANNIMVQLDRQINQLDKVYDDLNDTQTTLKRAEKHLKYFAKQVYTDKLMMCMIIVIGIAIIVIIALAIAGKTPKQLNSVK